MPVFDFQCQKCNHVWEFSRPFGSKDIPSCPECKGSEVEKLIAPPAIHFKGSGFYKTDSATGSTKSSAPNTDTKKEGIKAKEVKKDDAKPKKASSGDGSEKK